MAMKLIDENGQEVVRQDKMVFECDGCHTQHDFYHGMPIWKVTLSGYTDQPESRSDPRGYCSELCVRKAAGY